MNIAIVGATGNVGRKMLEILEQRKFPIDELDLSNYVIGYKKETYKYELYGVCNHSGGVMGGHYTSYIKNANGKWYLFNDRAVNEVKQESVVSQKAYVLFYRKKELV